MGPTPVGLFGEEKISFLWEIKPRFHICPTRSLVPVLITRPGLHFDCWSQIIIFSYYEICSSHRLKLTCLRMQYRLARYTIAFFFLSSQVFNRTGERRGKYMLWPLHFFLVNLEALEMIKQKLPNVPRLLRYACIS